MHCFGCIVDFDVMSFIFGSAGTFVSVLANTLVDQTLWRCFFRCPFCVSADSGKCRQTLDGEIVGHVLKFPALIPLVHVSLTGNLTAAWSYFTVWLIDGRSYALFAHSFLVLFFADTEHNFAPCDVHPWRIGGSVIAIVIMPGLWIVTPVSPGWNTVVYPSLANLFTLVRGVLSPGKMSASLALLVNCSKGSLVL
jgi:hypothetical protein